MIDESATAPYTDLASETFGLILACYRASPDYQAESGPQRRAAVLAMAIRLREEIEKHISTFAAMTIVSPDQGMSVVPAPRFSTADARRIALAVLTVHPELSDQTVAGMVGRSAKTIRRYRDAGSSRIAGYHESQGDT